MNYYPTKEFLAFQFTDHTNMTERIVDLSQKKKGKKQKTFVRIPKLQIVSTQKEEKIRYVIWNISILAKVLHDYG